MLLVLIDHPLFLPVLAALITGSVLIWTFSIPKKKKTQVSSDKSGFGESGKVEKAEGSMGRIEISDDSESVEVSAGADVLDLELDGNCNQGCNN